MDTNSITEQEICSLMSLELGLRLITSDGRGTSLEKADKIKTLVLELEKNPELDLPSFIILMRGVERKHQQITRPDTVPL